MLWLDILMITALFGGVGLYLYARASQRAQIYARVNAEVNRKSAIEHKHQRPTVAGRSLGLLQRIGQLLPLLSATQRAEASMKLVRAGLRSKTAILVLAGTTSLTCLLFAGLIWFFVRPILSDQSPLLFGLLMVSGCYSGLLLPRMVLDRLAARRQEAIRIALPDALDLLVICTNAGLGLNAAIERVAYELAYVAPALSDELSLTATELRLSSDTESVLNRLADRVGVESMRSLVTTFLQARQYGTPITQALRVLARSERTARMMRLEEQAARLAVKMTLPMMLFILPTVLIIGAGPALINLSKFFSTY